MLLELTSQLDVVEVVEAVDRVPQRLVVLLLDEKVVVGIVDSLDVQLSRRHVSTEWTTRRGSDAHMLYGDQV